MTSKEKTFTTSRGSPIKETQLQDPDIIIQSLINLRDEMLGIPGYAIVEPKMVVFKINSCLYSEFPHPKHKENYHGSDTEG